MGIFIEGKPGDVLTKNDNAVYSCEVFVGTYMDTELGHVCDMVFDPWDEAYPFHMAAGDSSRLCSWISAEGLPSGTLKRRIDERMILNARKWAFKQPVVRAARTLKKEAEAGVGAAAPMREKFIHLAGPNRNVIEWWEHQKPKNIRLKQED